ncbi:MAG TPA: hypothetical protein VK176_07790 [Phycisphaerales bacterium]|nr:hypothetical protein [Phycisphaerales bacterium]
MSTSNGRVKRGVVWVYGAALHMAAVGGVWAVVMLVRGGDSSPFRMETMWNDASGNGGVTVYFSDELLGYAAVRGGVVREVSAYGPGSLNEAGLMREEGSGVWRGKYVRYQPGNMHGRDIGAAAFSYLDMDGDGVMELFIQTQPKVVKRLKGDVWEVE